MELNGLLSKMSPGAMSAQEKTLTLVSKIHPLAFKELRAEKKNRSRCEDFEQLCELLREKAWDDTLERHIFNQQKEPKAYPRQQNLNVACQRQRLGKGQRKRPRFKFFGQRKGEIRYPAQRAAIQGQGGVQVLSTDRPLRESVLDKGERRKEEKSRGQEDCVAVFHRNPGWTQVAQN